MERALYNWKKKGQCAEILNKTSRHRVAVVQSAALYTIFVSKSTTEKMNRT